MAAIQYFAYGSNMLVERIRDRCPSAVTLGRAFVGPWRIEFSKTGMDGSGKATLVQSLNSDDLVFGVLFKISIVDLAALDHAEGQGYKRVENFGVSLLDDGSQSRSVTYIARDSALKQGLRPFDWYKALVIAGALQNDLPLQCIQWLRSVSTVRDCNIKRPTRLKALANLRLAGFDELISDIYSQ